MEVKLIHHSLFLYGCVFANIRILYHAITINFSLLRLLLIYNNSLQDILYNCYFFVSFHKGFHLKFVFVVFIL